jgi:hypothetical protein
MPATAGILWHAILRLPGPVNADEVMREREARVSRGLRARPVPIGNRHVRGLGLDGAKFLLKSEEQFAMPRKERGVVVGPPRVDHVSEAVHDHGHHGIEMNLYEVVVAALAAGVKDAVLSFESPNRFDKQPLLIGRETLNVLAATHRCSPFVENDLGRTAFSLGTTNQERAASTAGGRAGSPHPGAAGLRSKEAPWQTVVRCDCIARREACQVVVRHRD